MASIYKIDWITVSNVLEIQRRWSLKNALFGFSNVDVISDFYMSHMVAWRCGDQVRMNWRITRRCRDGDRKYRQLLGELVLRSRRWRYVIIYYGIERIFLREEISAIFSLRLWPTLWLSWFDKGKKIAQMLLKQIGEPKVVSVFVFKKDERDLNRSFLTSSMGPCTFLLLCMHFCTIINLPIFQKLIKLKAF